MKVFIAADHAGFDSKNSLITELEKKYIIHDMGPYELDPNDDYPIYAKKVSLAVKENPGSMGILICKSGEGMAIAANKIKGIRAVTVDSVEQAKETRQDNDSNVLSLSSKELSLREINEISKAWLNTKFSGLERHQRRIDEISRLERDML
jgi:ribose 5-phosphate isomerase B